jgi:hypothetical protein
MTQEEMDPRWREPKQPWDDKWWLLWGVDLKWLVRLETLDDVVPYLRAIPPRKVKVLQVCSDALPVLPFRIPFV